MTLTTISTQLNPKTRRKAKPKVAPNKSPMGRAFTATITTEAAKAQKLAPPRQKPLSGIVRQSYRPAPFTGLKSWLESLKSRGIHIVLEESNVAGKYVPTFGTTNSGVFAEDWERLRNNRERITALLLR